MEIVRHLDEPAWQKFISAHPQSQVFHTPEIFQVFQRAKTYEPAIWAVTGHNHCVLALLLPVIITLKDGFFSRLTSRAVVYGSVLYQHSPEGELALDQLLHAYTHQVNQKILFTELRNLSTLQAIQPVLHQHRFIYEEHLNYLINLKRSPDDLLQSFGKRTRKHIRQGLRNPEFRVELAQNLDDVKQCYKLIQNTYRFARLPLADWTVFESAWQIMHPKGMIQFWLTYINNHVAAASVELLFKDIIYGWYAGTNRSFSSYNPGELLMWRVLEWGAKNGYRVYDFGGAGKPGEDYGVRDFKAKFGGDLVCFGRNTCVHNPTLLYLSKVGYNIYRKLLLPFQQSPSTDGSAP